MKKIKNFYNKLPKWLKPNAEQVAAGKVVIKAFVKGVIIAGSAILTTKLGGNLELSAAVAGITHALIKWVDPTDTSIGINSTN